VRVPQPLAILGVRIRSGIFMSAVGMTKTGPMVGYVGVGRIGNAALKVVHELYRHLQRVAVTQNAVVVVRVVVVDVIVIVFVFHVDTLSMV